MAELKVKKVDDKAFDMMTAVSDKTDVSIIPPDKKEVSTKNIHHALMAAGMSPAFGNIADVADATLYALEGEFGEAAWSMAAAIPVIGQMVTGKRALKAAKEAGEEMVTLYRGIPDWFPGKMVKEGKFVSPEKFKAFGETITQPYPGRGTWVSSTKEGSKGYRNLASGRYNPQTGKKKKPGILEFEVPKKWWDRKTKEGGAREFIEEGEYWVPEGIPKEFLKKVHK